MTGLSSHSSHFSLALFDASERGELGDIVEAQAAEKSPRKKRERPKPRADAAPRVKGLAKKQAETEQLNEQGESGKPGRPPMVFDDEMVETITALVGAEGYSKEDVALYFGVSRDVIYDRCNRDHVLSDPRITDAFARGFIIARADVGVACYREARAGSLGHIIHWQKRFGVYAGAPTKLELTGANGGAMETRDVPLTNEEIAARVQGLIDRQESTIANPSPEPGGGAA